MRATRSLGAAISSSVIFRSALSSSGTSTRAFDAEELRTWIAEHRAAERRRQARRQPIRETVTPPESGKRAGRRRDRSRGPEQPKRSSEGKGEHAVDDSGQAQRRLFDA
jgi:hypothetical protein